VEEKSVKTSTVLTLVGWIAVILSLILVLIGWMGLSGASTYIILSFINYIIISQIWFFMGLGAVSSASSMIMISAIILVAAAVIQLVGVILAMREMENKTPTILVLVGWIVVIISFILVLIGWMGLSGAYNVLILSVVLPIISSYMVFPAILYHFMGLGAVSSASSMIMISAILLVAAAVIQLIGVILAMRK